MSKNSSSSGCVSVSFSFSSSSPGIVLNQSLPNTRIASTLAVDFVNKSKNLYELDEKLKKEIKKIYLNDNKKLKFYSNKS